ncbi:MAG TPA: hypothetical protein VNO33_24525 [Kofleriaceae bacterium]|nr:hypothetical protein [Kofleriaceae bacterium]
MSAAASVWSPWVRTIAATSMAAGLGCGGRGSPADRAPRSPELFAPGRVSTARPEFATSFSPDGRTVYFDVASDDRKELEMVYAVRENGQWSEARPLRFSDGTYRDVDPFVTADGRRLYFSSNRPLSGTAPKPDFGTWFVERTAGGWGAPVHAGPALDSGANEVYVSLTRSGTVYFGSDAAGQGRRDIYRAPLVGGEYRPERISLRMAGAAPDQPDLAAGNPCIDPGERFLVFVADGGPDNPDLFISWRRDGRFGPARNLGPAVNSSQADFAPALGPDGETLYFTSERPGVVPAGAVPGRPPGDIYRVDLAAILAAAPG